MIHKVALFGREFTIQTELVTGDRPKIRTLVYDGGRLVSSREVSVGSAGTPSKEVEAAVQLQHSRIIDTLIRRAEELGATRAPAPAPAVGPRPPEASHPSTAKAAPCPRVDQGSALAEAIAVRQTIGPFSLAFAGPAPTTADAYRQTLDAVAASIDAIREAPTYSAIRLDEQLALIALRSQLDDWQEAGRDGDAAAEIWTGVARFATHLQKINHRRDLVAFDQQLLTWAMAQLGRGDITDELLAELHHLGGRDGELDRLLRNPAAATSFELLEMLMRLMDRTLA
jgi:hypothetical protein